MRTAWSIAAALALATACTDEQAVHCGHDADCDSYGGGTCVRTTDGPWCAYSSSGCEGTFLRYADDVPAELASTCVAPQLLVGSVEPAERDLDVSPRTSIAIELLGTVEGQVENPMLQVSCGGDIIEGTVTYDALSRRLELVPDTLLPLATGCGAVVTAGNPDVIPPAPHRWSFQTRPGAWQPAEAISEAYTEAPAASPQVTVGRRGDAMVHWAVPGTGDLAWATQTAAGGWTDVGTTGDSTMAGVAASFDAGVALWRQRSPGDSSAPWELTSSPLPAGQPWAPRPTPVTVGIVGDPVVAADHRGNAVAAWLQGDASGQRIMASHYDRVAGGWAAPVAIDGAAAAERSALRIAALDTGRFVLVWMAQVPPGSGFHVLRSNHEGRGWSLPAEVSADASFDLDAPAIAPDSEGNLVVVWRHGAGAGRHRILARRVGPVTSVIHVLDDGQTPAPGTPQVARNHGGTVTAIWLQETTAGRRLVALDLPPDTNGWVPSPSSVVDTAADMPWHTIVLGARSEPVVAWSICEGGRTSLHVDGHAPPEGGPIADMSCDARPALAANPAGELILVWDHRDEVAGTWQLHARTFR
jgi:hypothetical protein